ncbi:hypothetical protein GA0070611_3033 [Micromonospora auratinigra]|uniref:Uncharacterized protein n=2 Tax=Micromonospora auratinigra TaxID=261654 RepID=A0A1A8ZNI8_9ACTN|nr:hypothetical protein GA0070611_3033 [Micromonospora auratinigra]
MDAAFPGRLRAVEVAGVHLVLLDSTVAGCVGSWLDHGGELGDRWWDVLAGCERELERVIPELSGDEAAYCRRLLEMTVLVLEA